MKQTDQLVQEICEIKFKTKDFTLQKIINKAGEDYYALECDNLELYSCPADDLGGMLNMLCTNENYVG